jgi:hypothetical protein
LSALNWCDGTRNLAEVIRLTALEMGAQNFDFVGYFNSTRSTNAWSSCNRHGSLIDTGPCRSYSHFYLSLGLTLEG